MKPASEAIVANAINSILGDIKIQNRDCSPASERLTSDADISPAVLDGQIESLLEALRSVEVHVQLRIRHAKARRNGLSFIHRLPVETLVEIFETVANGELFLDCYPQALGRLSSVCTFWATIINQVPKLWTTVFDHYHPRLIDKIISRSGEYPLSLLSSEYHNGNTIYRYQTMESFLKRLRSTAHRWEVIELSIREEDGHFLETCLGDLSTPKLKKLRIQLKIEGGIFIDPFRGGTGHLEELDLAAATIHWTSPLLSRLQILRLRYSGAEMTTNRLLTTLAQCLNLSELLIDNFCFDGSTTSERLSTRLELPHLQVLDLIEIDPSTAAYSILSRISSPKYKHFRFVSAFEEEPHSGDVLPSFSHHIPSLRHLVASSRKVVIDLGLTNCRYVARSNSTPDGPLFHLDVGHQSPMMVLLWIKEAFPDMLNGVDTKLTVGRDAPVSEEDVTIICSRIPTITTLRVLGNPSPFIRYLATPTLVNGKQDWPLPELTSLIIQEDASDPDEILEMLEGRYGHDTASESNARLPQRLLSLVIHGSKRTLDSPTFWQICQVVGKDHLVFENEQNWDIDPDFDYDVYSWVTWYLNT